LLKLHILDGHLLIASLTLLRKVEEEPQLLVDFVVTDANAAVVLEEEHMACLDQ